MFFWCVFVVNVVVLVLVFVGFVLVLVMVLVLVVVSEFVVLVVGLVLLLGVDLVLLCLVFALFDAFADLMRCYDLFFFGCWVVVLGDLVLVMFACAFNEMFDWFEYERCDSVWWVLLVQEDECGWIACELHDEVG